MFKQPLKSFGDVNENFKTYSLDFGVDVHVSPVRNGKFFIEAPLQTDKIFPEEILRRDFETAYNKEVRSFHIPPETNIKSFVGVVNKVWWDDLTNKPWVRLEIFGNSRWGRDVQQILLEDAHKPLSERRIKGVSAGVLEWYMKGTKRLMGFHVREVSLAENPACDICTVRKISLNEKNLERNPLSKEYEDNPLIRNYDKLNKQLEAKIAEYDETIKTQFSQLTKLKQIIDDKDSKIAEYEAMEIKFKALQLKTETYEDRFAIVSKYEKFSNDPSDKEAYAKWQERMDELAAESPETLKNILKGYERMVNLQKNGIQQGGNPDKAGFQTPQLLNFDGVNPNDLPADQFRKAVDQVIDQHPENKDKVIGGF